MCSNATKTARRSTRSMNKTTPTTPNSARKTRTKTRKHRFLSLRRHLFSKQQPPPTSPDPDSSSGRMTSRDAHQLNLFPLHPENLFQDKDDNVPVTCFFDADTCAGPATTTLDGLLWSGASEEEEEEEEDMCSLYSPSSLTCAVAHDNEGSNGSLERAAFVRSNVREREESEEKWVRYEEVIGWSGEHRRERDSGGETRGLSLKLDYQEIMNAWMDKGPLYIDGDGPAIVPDLLHDVPQHQHHQQQDCSTSTVKVPVMGVDEEEGREGGEVWKMGQNREARVLRYKEKRQSRLFAKRIRYEVRKLNAEKRPRLKGRFVKRN